MHALTPASDDSRERMDRLSGLAREVLRLCAARGASQAEVALNEDRGLSVDIIPLSGSVELGPLAGLADVIVDMVETGTTLKENHLVEVDTLLESEAVLIVNRASHTLKAGAVTDLIAGLAGVVTV